MAVLSASNFMTRRLDAYTQSPLSQNQIVLDATLNSFTQNAANPTSLVAMSVGAFSFRLAKLGFLQGATFLKVAQTSPKIFLQGAASLSALSLEVSVFRGTNQLLEAWAGSPPSQGVFDRKAWLGTATDFLFLKSFYGLGAIQNPVLSHFVQANAMVLGHEVSAQLGFTYSDPASYIEKLARAEANNLALHSGISLARYFSPGLVRLEQSLLLQSRSLESTLPNLLALGNRNIPIARMASQESEIAPENTGLWLSQIAKPHFRRVRDRNIQKPSRHEVSANQRIAILTSGGDGPGENAVIQHLVTGILRSYRSAGWETLGIWEGFRGLIEPEGRILSLRETDVIGAEAIRSLQARIYNQGFDRHPRHRGIAEIGGNLLKSSRTNPLHHDPEASQVKATMARFGIDALVVLGGNGSMGASRDLAAQGVPVVFIPQSIDNDVPGTHVSVGFPSAVAEGVKNVSRFYHTAHSCDRWFLVEVMGQQSGALALSIAREAKTDGVFIGEFPRPLSEIQEIIKRRRSEGRYHGVILVSEGVKFIAEDGSLIEIPKPKDAQGRLLIQSGQTASWLSDQVGRAHTRPESLAYLLRGAVPTSSEINLARVLSEGAIQLLAARQYGHMVGVHWNQNHWRRDYTPLQTLRGAQYLLGQTEFLHVLGELGTVHH